jgi:hypothetical protein
MVVALTDLKIMVNDTLEPERAAVEIENRRPLKSRNNQIENYP